MQSARLHPRTWPYNRAHEASNCNQIVIPGAHSRGLRECVGRGPRWRQCAGFGNGCSLRDTTSTDEGVSPPGSASLATLRVARPGMTSVVALQPKWRGGDVGFRQNESLWWLRRQPQDLRMQMAAGYPLPFPEARMGTLIGKQGDPSPHFLQTNASTKSQFREKRLLAWSRPTRCCGRRPLKIFTAPPCRALLHSTNFALD